MVSSGSFLDEHLNVNWLRPESALWNAIASTVVSQYKLVPPSLDLGSGNGFFSFITAGGGFSPNYDWYRNVNPDGFWENRDIYDTFVATPKRNWIVKEPSYQIDCALDAKINLLCQTQALEFYRHFVLADANLACLLRTIRFRVFSPIFYIGWTRRSIRCGRSGASYAQVGAFCCAYRITSSKTTVSVIAGKSWVLRS